MAGKVMGQAAAHGETYSIHTLGIDAGDRRDVFYQGACELDVVSAIDTAGTDVPGVSRRTGEPRGEGHDHPFATRCLPIGRALTLTRSVPREAVKVDDQRDRALPIVGVRDIENELAGVASALDAARRVPWLQHRAGAGDHGGRVGGRSASRVGVAS